MAGLIAAIEAVPAEEAGRMLSLLSADDRSLLLETLPPEEAAALVAELDEAQAADFLGEMSAKTAAMLVEELDSGDRADVLDELDDDEAEAVLAEMSPESAGQERERRAYPEGSAGELMSREFLGYPLDMPIANLVKDLREKSDDYAEYAVQYAYVIDREGALCGVLRLRDILLARSGRTAKDLMIPKPVSISVDTTLDRLIALFRDKPFLGIPVVGEGESPARCAREGAGRRGGAAGGEAHVPAGEWNHRRRRIALDAARRPVDEALGLAGARTSF